MQGNWQQIEVVDYARIQPIMQEVVAAEEYLVLPADATDEDCIAYWFKDGKGEVFVYEEEDEILGSFYLRPNYSGLGGHVANGGYIVASAARGRGIGRKLGEKSIEEAKKQGYRALQFNFVVSTNTPAVRLWETLGFKIIGTIPEGFHEKRERFVDVYIMHKDFTDA